MARKRSKSPSKKKKSPAKKRKASKSPAKKKSKAKTTKAAGGSTKARNSLYFVTFIMAFYMLTYFGVMGDPWAKFFGRPNSAGPLCGDLTTWMGLMLFAYSLNNTNYLLNGNESDQKKLLFTRSMQFTVWFMMVVTGGRQGAPGGHGLMVDSEYFQAIACCFFTGWVCKLGSEGFTPSPGKVDTGSAVTRCFLVFAAFIMLNTFTIGVMGGDTYYPPGASVSADCANNCAWFASMVYLQFIDVFSACQGGSDAVKKGVFANYVIINVIGTILLLVRADHFDAAGLQLGMAVNAIQVGTGVYGYLQL